MVASSVLERPQVEMAQEEHNVEVHIAAWRRRLEGVFAMFRSAIEKREEFAVSEVSYQDYSVETKTVGGAGSVSVPQLEIQRNGKLAAIVEPVGLWLLNGTMRIDISTTNGQFTLSDNAEMSCSPEWLLYSSDSQTSQQFTEGHIIKILGL